MSFLVRVIKVGGSLMWDQQLASKLNGWLDQQSQATNLFVAGGGLLADCVRHAETEWEIASSHVHYSAVEMMDINSLVILQALPKCTRHIPLETLLANPSSFMSDQGERPIVLTLNAWIRHSNLPHSWDVTSDSIAAEIATKIEALGFAVELVLLKSQCSSVAGNSLVDPYFATAAEPLNRPVRLVNLKADTESQWAPQLYDSPNGH